MAGTLVTSSLSVSERRLEGKVALIVGGASGIGKSIVRHFIKHGARVCIADLQDELGEKILSLGSGTHVRFIHCDITKEDDITKAVDFTAQTFGTIDIMVNNVDIRGSIVPDIREFDFGEFKKVVEANVNGVFLGMKHAARVMIPRGKGSIISIAGAAGTTASLGSHSYIGSKQAVVGLTKSLAEMLGRHGIRVNCVSPYEIPSRLAAVDPDGNLEGVELEDDDVAEAMLFLASDGAKYVSGLNLTLDGGFTVVNS